MALFEIAEGHRIQEGGMGGFMVNGRKILLARHKGQYYAIDAACPHMGGDLSGGTLDGKYVVCPRHGHKIDITSGEHAGGFSLPFLKSGGGKGKTYKVITEGDKVKIEL